jgi:DNA gyrase/topoisomerase IV subunit A
MLSKNYFFDAKSKFYSLKLNLLNKITQSFLRRKFASIKIYKHGDKKKKLELNENTVLFISKKSNLDILSIYFLNKIFQTQNDLFFIYNNANLNKIFNTSNISKLNRFIFKLVLKHLGGERYKKSLVEKIYDDDLDEITFKKFFAPKTHLYLASELNLESSEIIFLSNLIKQVQNSKKNLKIIIINPVYDFLIEKKPPSLHFIISNPIELQPKERVSSILAKMEYHLNNNLVLNSANLLSFALFTTDFKNGISRNILFFKLKRLAQIVHKDKIMFVAKDCLEKSYDDLFARILLEAKENGYIRFNQSSKQYFATKKLYNFREIQRVDSKIIKSKNKYRSHLKDLLPKYEKLKQIWKEINFY